MKNRQRAKRVEAAVARKMKGKRVGILGKEDVEHPLFSVEVKLRKRFVAEKWMLQAMKNCSKDKIPIVVVHLPYQRYGDSFVIIRLRDFEDLNGKLIKRTEEAEK